MRVLVGIVGLILTLSLMFGCRTSTKQVSGRQMPGLEKPGRLYMHQGSKYARKKPELYVKRKTLKISPVERDNETGSLFNLDDQRNYLYLEKPPFAVGQFLDVKVVSTRTAKENEGDDAGGGADESSGDAVVKELLESLPQLEPGEAAPKLIGKLKMKIAYVYENGDAMAVMKRSSQKESQANEIDIRARIPYASLIGSNTVSTNDLVDVHWTESANGRITERYSSGWEDEYSLRLSGFTEAKSKYALQLADKQKQLEGVKDRLRNQLVSLGKERQTLAKERSKLLEEKSKQGEILDTMQKELDTATNKNKDLESQIEEQKKQIEELRAPADKPGDAKDGADGA